ncbi:MAG: aldo/keto reductase [Xenococcaceae cyanobacterium]
MQRILLGNTGIEVSKLCIGTGTKAWGGTSRQTRRLGLHGLADLLVYAYEKGITFIDTADKYGSHRHVREALKRIPRKEIVVTTKTFARNENQIKSDLNRFRKELDTDYLDIVLLHCMMAKNWNVRLRSVMDVLSDAKEQGIVRAVGCSNHNYGALCTAAQEPWVDVVLVRINPKGLHMEGKPSQIIPVIEQMKDSGKGTYGMKVMGEGKLGRDPKFAIRYQLETPVDAFVIGMESKAEVDENVRLLEEFSMIGQY